jgi:CTP:phosphocholine cytidylyltransferase-like protein/thiamine kinase-like enzyme
MINTVIIPTAGTGSRMGNYTKNLNKALLPYKDKPVLAHIIDNFPRDSEFIIPVGYLADQIKDFCKVAYSDRNIKFVEIPDYTSSDSGTATTIKYCKDLIKNPFWYIPCDTYFNQSVYDKVSTTDCYFVKTVPENQTHLYTMFDLDNNFKIKQITFKQSQPDTWTAFTGVSYIYDWQKFLENLNQITSVEIIDTIETGNNTLTLNTWLDFGSPEIYKTELAKSQKFDFTKTDELTYICNNRVVKWYADAAVAEKKYRKTLANPKVCPDNCTYSNSFMAYDFFKGQVLYQFNNPVMFNNMLNWLHNDVWIKRPELNIETESVEFYKTKTLSRVNKFLEKHTQLPNINYVDGIAVKDYQYYLNRIDWDYLTKNNLPGFIHGDLHFDNTVINSAGEFKIIDWRHEFAGLVDCGDIYYDLAKMAGGLIINYANIKNHNFNIEIDNGSVTLSIPNVDHITVYQEQLKNYILTNNLDYKKVQQLVPIIFWNMSPLHTAPFDIFLWYLGIKLFAELDNE